MLKATHHCNSEPEELCFLTTGLLAWTVKARSSPDMNMTYLECCSCCQTCRGENRWPTKYRDIRVCSLAACQKWGQVCLHRNVGTQWENTTPVRRGGTATVTHVKQFKYVNQFIEDAIKNHFTHTHITTSNIHILFLLFSSKWNLTNKRLQTDSCH